MASLDNSAVYEDEYPLYKSCKELESLREDPDFSELEIQVKNGGIVRAQKIVLAARIPFLRTKVTAGRLVWDRYDVDVNCVRALISYAYTGKLTVTSENVAEILSFSKDLQMKETVQFCCTFAQDRLSLENVSRFWSLSTSKEISNLKNSCLHLMQNQFESFVSTSLLVELSFEDLQSLISSDDLQVTGEESVFEAIKRWTQADVQSNRADQLTDLMKCIRWDQTSADFLQSLPENNAFVQKNNACVNYLLNVYAMKEGCFNLNPRKCDQIILTFGKPSSGKREWIVESYDPSTEQSKTLAHLTYRQYAAVVPVGRKEVMIAGGEIDGKYSSSVEVLSCREKKIRPVASLNFARCGHCACAVGDAVVVCGGFNGGCLNSCEVFSGDRWILLPEMKEVRDDVAVVSSPDRRVFAIGGLNREDVRLSSVEFCRLPVDFASSPPPAAGFWRSLASMREARRAPAAVFFEGKILVAGGCNENYLSSVEMLSIADERAQWVSLPASMKEKRRYFCLVVAFKEIFAFGNDRSPYNSVERLQLNRTKNSTTQSLSNSLPAHLSSSQLESWSPITSMQRVWGAVVIPRSLL